MTYKPEFLPVALVIDKEGVSIRGDGSLATPIGEFSIGASYNLNPPAPDTIYVILRDHKAGFDHIYDVETGGEAFTAVVNGTTSISIANNQVTIDITNGGIRRVSFKRAIIPVSEQGPGHSWFHGEAVRWNAGWSKSWYKPFMMSSWSYSDSTITKWDGVGFVVFLIRFLLAMFLGVFDFLLTILFLIGQMSFMLIGPSVWPGGLG